MTKLTQIGTPSDWVPVTPNDGQDLGKPARALRCLPLSGTGGTVRVTMSSGEVRNSEIAQGEIIFGGIVRVHATGTSATGLEAHI